MNVSTDQMNELNEQFTLLKLSLNNRLSQESMTFFPKETQVQEIRKIQKETNASLSIILRALIDAGLLHYQKLT